LISPEERGKRKSKEIGLLEEGGGLFLTQGGKGKAGGGALGGKK